MSVAVDTPASHPEWTTTDLYHSPLGLFEFQAEGIAQAYLGSENGGGNLVVWDTGCLQGDAEITVNRGGNSRRYPLSEVVRMFNGGISKNGHGWNLNIPTRVQREVDGEVRLAELSGAWRSGTKQTFTVTTVSGRTLRGSVEHPFLTQLGWVRLDQLEAGDLLHVIGAQAQGQPREAKPHYRQVSWLVAHPYAVSRGVRKSPHRVATHRLVAEAEMNKMDLDVFISIIRLGDVAGLTFLDPKIWAVHHIDHDPLNNDPRNLQVLTHPEHHRLHAHEGKTRNVLYKIAFEAVASVEPYGEEMTYDLEVVGEPHNFLANGIVVHNTGKSHFGMRMSTLLAEDMRDQIRDHDLTILVCEKAKISEWAQDFDKYTRQSSRIHHGPSRMRKLAQEGMPDVLITTYETAKADLVRFVKTPGRRGTSMEHGPLLEAIDGTSVLWICDEMGKLRNRTSANYKAFDYTFRKMRKSRPTDHRVFGLTATPIEKDWEDAFNQCRLIRPDLMPGIGEFESYFVKSRDPFGRARYRHDRMGEFATLCRPVILRKRKTDPDVIAQFPKKVEEVRHLVMAPDQAGLYEMVESLQWDLEGDEPVPGLWTALRQVAGGPASLVRSAQVGDSVLVKSLVAELGAQYLLGISSVKEQALIEYLTPLVNDEGAKVVVFTFFGQTLLPILAGALRQKGFKVYENHGGLSSAEMGRVRQAFRDDAKPCVFLTSDAGSRGINLPEATYVVEYESALTYANRTQRLDRIHRIDSDSPSVTCMTFIVDHTVEVAVIERMSERNAQTDVLLDDLDAGENFMTAADRRAALQISSLSKRKARR